VEASHVAAGALANLNWGTFFYKNLLPVTLGNIVGGSGMVGLLYWISLRKKTA
jgi:formate/nitrite transporter FocA (FNT family)